jgi:hypothetical protein
MANAPFPLPAHRTGRADFRHPALRLVSPAGTRIKQAARVFCSAGFSPPPNDTAISDGSSPLMVFRGLSTNHLDLAVFESAPEVRGLPSAGITRFQQYYAPVRLPPDPSPSATLKPRPPIERVSPVTRFTLPACRAHYPGGSNGCTCRLLPHPCGLPRFAGGSASASLLSRPAQALLAVGLLNRPRRPLSRGFNPAGCPAKLLVSYQGNRQFPGWNLPPLVKRAFRGALHNS